MFEKEAKEYGDNYVKSKYMETVDETWRKGAEFGYNKAKVEVEDSYRETLCNSELNLASVTEQLEELEKANEWHNINDIEPSKEQFGKQLLIRIESIIGDTDFDYLVYKYKGESITDVAGVLAWKEIE